MPVSCHFVDSIFFRKGMKNHNFLTLNIFFRRPLATISSRFGVEGIENENVEIAMTKACVSRLQTDDPLIETGLRRAHRCYLSLFQLFSLISNLNM